MGDGDLLEPQPCESNKQADVMMISVVYIIQVKGYQTQYWWSRAQSVIEYLSQSSTGETTTTDTRRKVRVRNESNVHFD